MARCALMNPNPGEEHYIYQVVDYDPGNSELFVPCPDEARQDDVIYKGIFYPADPYAVWRSFNTKTKKFVIDENAKLLGEMRKRIAELDVELERIDTYSIRPGRALDAAGPDDDVTEDRAILAHLEGLAATLREERAALQSAIDEIMSENTTE